MPFLKGHKPYYGALKHGHARGGCNGKTPIYFAWKGMLSRCNNTKNADYLNYGGRGIKVCERWLNFANFLEDMGPKPKGLTLDRIDSNRDYDPANCRWATRLEQSRNRRHVSIYIVDGVSYFAADLEKKLGLHKGAIRQRISKGWSVYNACTIARLKKWSKRHKPYTLKDGTILLGKAPECVGNGWRVT